MSQPDRPEQTSALGFSAVLFLRFGGLWTRLLLATAGRRKRDLSISIRLAGPVVD